MSRLIMQGIAITVALWLLLNIYMYLQQPSMTFFPARELPQTPADWGMPYGDVNLVTASSERVHGWYIPAPGARYTVLFLHGNGGNIGHRGETVEILHRLGLNVLLIDYRGYGNSEGRPGEEAMYEDARLAWDYLLDAQGQPPHRIIVFGRSLGGAVAAHLAAEVTPAALILESTFSSVRDMARELHPLLSRLVWLRYRFPVVDNVARVAAPVLVLHSPEDDVIPYRFGRRVFEAARPPREFVELRGDHNSGFLDSQPRYQLALRDFIRRYVDARPGGKTIHVQGEGGVRV